MGFIALRLVYLQKLIYKQKLTYTRLPLFCKAGVSSSLNHITMNLTKEFTLYVKENNIDITSSNYEEHMKAFKEKLVSETTEMEMCGYELSLGDWVKVQIGGNGHFSGGRLEGKIKALYPHIPQVKLESGWCFHPSDEILKHIPSVSEVSE